MQYTVEVKVRSVLHYLMAIIKAYGASHYLVITERFDSLSDSVVRSLLGVGDNVPVLDVEDIVHTVAIDVGLVDYFSKNEVAGFYITRRGIDLLVKHYPELEPVLVAQLL